MPHPVEEKTSPPGRAAEPDRLLSAREVAAAEKSPLPWVCLILLALAAAVLRSTALNQQLWYDEIAAVLHSLRKPVSTMLTTYTTQNFHPLYSILARATIFVWGEHPWTLRLPAVIFGVLSIPALYFFGRLVTTRREGLLAAALMAVSYHHVWFSQNARGYTAMLFWTLLASYVFLRGLKQRGWATWVAYSIVMSLALYTHLTMAFVAIVHGLTYIWLRARAPHRVAGNIMQPLGGFLFAGILALALYAPLLPQLLSRTLGQAGPAIRWEWKDPLWLIQETLRGLKAGAGGIVVAPVFAGLLAITGLLSFWRRDRYMLGLMLLPPIITAAVMFALEHNLWPRFFFFALGFAFLFLVRGAFVWGETLARLFRRDERAGLSWGTALVVLMLVGSAWSLLPAYRYPKQDFIGAMKFLEGHRQPGEAVVTVGRASFAYQNYFGRPWHAVETRGELEALRARGQRTWLVYFFPIDVKSRYPEIWQTIHTEFETVAVFRGTLGGGEIYVCQAAPRPTSPLAAR